MYDKKTPMILYCCIYQQFIITILYSWSSPGPISLNGEPKRKCSETPPVTASRKDLEVMTTSWKASDTSRRSTCMNNNIIKSLNYSDKLWSTLWHERYMAVDRTGMFACPHTLLIVYRYLTKKCMQQRPCCYYMGVASIDASTGSSLLVFTVWWCMSSAINVLYIHCFIDFMVVKGHHQ